MEGLMKELQLCYRKAIRITFKESCLCITINCQLIHIHIMLIGQDIWCRYNKDKEIHQHINPIPIAIGELITPFLKNYAVMNSWRNVCMGK